MSAQPPGGCGRSGFTIIELSIVLVIIGLIAGGIMMGRDLIEAAKVRKFMSQIDEYNAAVNTFRAKYNGLPGDLLASQATALGFQPATPADGSPGHSDGNGAIEACSAGTTNGAQCETVLFWQQLSQAKLIQETFSSVSNGNTSIDGCADFDAATTKSYLPTTPLTATPAINPSEQGGSVSFLTVYTGSSGKNYFEVMTLLDSTAVHCGSFYMRGGGLSAVVAQSIDTKLDDGLPLTGAITAVYLTTDTLDTPGSLFGCISTSAENPYDVIHNNGCNLRIQAAF